MAEQAPPTVLTSPVIPDFDVWVCVNGQPAPVYGIQIEGNKSTGYIESVEGAEFTVHTRDRRTEAPQYAYSNRLYVDGNWVCGKFKKLDSEIWTEPLDSTSRLLDFTGYLESATSERPLVFAKALTTDDDEIACTDEKIVKGMGVIQVAYLRIKTFGAVYTPEAKAAPAEVRLHEASKKAQLSHQARFGESKTIKPTTFTDVTFLDPVSSPHATFHFVYRSRALLEIRGLVPALPVAEAEPHASSSTSPHASSSTSPHPISSGSGSNKKRCAEITIDSDSEEEADPALELQRLRARVAELERKQVKAEPSAARGKDDKPNVKKVKREQGEASGPGQKKVKAEAIELD